MYYLLDKIEIQLNIIKFMQIVRCKEWRKSSQESLKVWRVGIKTRDSYDQEINWDFNNLQSQPNGPKGN